jgi:hypothetical protein
MILRGDSSRHLVVGRGLLDDQLKRLSPFRWRQHTSDTGGLPLGAINRSLPQLADFGLPSAVLAQLHTAVLSVWQRLQFRATLLGSISLAQ